MPWGSRATMADLIVGHKQKFSDVYVMFALAPKADVIGHCVLKLGPLAPPIWVQQGLFTCSTRH